MRIAESDRLRHVAEEVRAVRHDVVDVAVAVGVDDHGALRLLDEERRRADRLERADGRADAARHLRLRAGVEPVRLGRPADAAAAGGGGLLRRLLLRGGRRGRLPPQSSLQPLGSLLRVVGQDQVGARALHRGEDLERDALAVDPAALGGGLHHRVLARDVVGGERDVRGFLRRADDVEVGEGRLDHDHVGPLLDVGEDLLHRLADVRRVHLVGAAVAERRRRLGRVAERAVEAARVLGRVGEDRDAPEAVPVERLADRPHPAVHHVGRRDDVGPGLRVGERLGREDRERAVVVDPLVHDDAAVPVVGVLAEADVGDDDRLRARLLDLPDGPADRPEEVGRGGADGVLVVGDAEEDDREDAAGGELGGVLRREVGRDAVDARHRRDRLADPLARDDEHRGDEVGRVEGRLADHRPERLGEAQAAVAVEGERHGQASLERMSAIRSVRRGRFGTTGAGKPRATRSRAVSGPTTPNLTGGRSAGPSAPRASRKTSSAAREPMARASYSPARKARRTLRVERREGLLEVDDGCRDVEAAARGARPPRRRRRRSRAARGAGRPRRGAPAPRGCRRRREGRG